MIKRFINKYYDFFDNKVWDTTLVVWIISTMIFLVWFLSNNTSSYYKSNILEYKNNNQNIIMIDWKRYKLVFEEMR